MVPGERPSGRYQLMMGPWYHVTAGKGINTNRLELAWFDRWLKHRATGIDRTRTQLHLYQLGTGRWLDASRYPLARSRPRTYFLRSRGGLGRGRPGRAGGSDRLLYTGASSPCARTTEQWGAGLLELMLEAAGGADPCAGDDSSNAGPGVATYTTRPFRRPRVISGPIDATLYVSANRPETELVATLDDVAPNGRSTPLTSGALLGSFRKLDRRHSWLGPHRRPLLPYHPFSRASQRPVPAGRSVRYDVEIFPTFAELRRGHRLRLRVATSDFPHLAPIPSEAVNLAGGVYELRHDRGHPSFLEVPTAPGRAFRARCRICR
jgi:putative CocE/NonD family hydrolase